jgi:xylulokinase
MNLPVRVPAGAEADAMGGAIQALWCLQSNKPNKQPKKQNDKETIESLADEHVVLEGGATIKPDKKDAAAYDAAYAVYSRYLGALSPLYK